MTSVTAETNTFHGIISFDTALECSNAVLGSKVEVVIGGVTGVLEFPSAPDWGTEESDADHALHTALPPPCAATTWKQGEEKIVWGYPVPYPAGTSHVDKVLLTFELADDQIRAQAAAINRALPGWYKLFNQYFELITRQRIFSKVEYIGASRHIDLFRWGADGRIERPYDIDQGSLNLIMSDDNASLLEIPQLKEICILASSCKPPQLQYQIQLEAYRAIREGDFRKAILETASAAELGLGRAALDAMSKDGVKFKEQLMKKYSALGGKFTLARMVGVTLPSVDYDKRLINPRNDVVHRGQFADRVSAADAIAVTDELLRTICPILQETA